MDDIWIEFENLYDLYHQDALATGSNSKPDPSPPSSLGYEHIAPQIIQLGSFIFDANKNIIMKEGVLANTATMETKLIFQGNNLHNKIEEKKEPGKEAMVISYSDGLHQRANQGGG